MAGTPTLPPKSPASGGRTFFFYGFFADPGTMGAHVDSLSGLLPEGATEIIRDQLTRVAAHGKSTLGLTFAFGLLLSLWSANAAVKALFDALKIVYAEEEKRGFIRLNLLSLTFTALGIIFALLVLGAVVVIPVVLMFLGPGTATI